MNSSAAPQFFEHIDPKRISKVISQALFIKPTRTTPYILFNKEKGVLIIKGRSCPEDALKFYKPVSNSLFYFLQTNTSTLTVNFGLEYFNTSSAKCLFNIFKLLKSAKSNGNKVNINWYYEMHDDDMLECGEDYEEALGINFNYVMIA